MESSRARMAAGYNSHSRQLKMSGAKLGMSILEGLGAECSDELDFLIMRRDRLNEQIERSYDYLCEELTSSGIGRGGAGRSALSPSSLMIGAQVRAQKMMAKGRGAILKKK